MSSEPSLWFSHRSKARKLGGSGPAGSEEPARSRVIQGPAGIAFRRIRRYFCGPRILKGPFGPSHKGPQGNAGFHAKRRKISENSQRSARKPRRGLRLVGGACRLGGSSQRKTRPRSGPSRARGTDWRFARVSQRKHGAANGGGVGAR